MKQEVKKIFDDLDDFRDYCRFNGKVFDEANLYKRDNEIWQSYKESLKRKQ